LIPSAAPGLRVRSLISFSVGQIGVGQRGTGEIGVSGR
jgi:hypothetical protein